MSRFEFEPEEIEQLADAVAQRVLAALQQGSQAASPQTTATIPQHISEPAAAALFGVDAHVLRDARKRGELHCVRVGKFVRYEPAQLEEWKRRNTDREVRKNGAGNTSSS